MHFHISRKSTTLCHKVLTALVIIFLPIFLTQVNGQFKPAKVVRSSNIMIQDGKKYYMHEVKEGHTLYSVSRAYNVSQKILSQENPNVPHISSGTLPLGVVIRIPYVEIIEPAPESEKDYERYYYHIVEPKETLSSLSRQYKVHYKKIIENNPGVEERLLIGMEVKIPKTQVATVRESYPVEDTLYLYHTVKKGENTIRLAEMYGMRVRDLREANPGMRWGLDENEVIKIPRDLISNTWMLPQKDKEPVIWQDQDEIIDIEAKDSLVLSGGKCADLLRPHDNQVFNVAFLLPLYLNINDTLNISDSLPYPSNEIYDVRFLEFIEGAYLAIDSLKNYGIRMNVSIYDTERDPMIVSALFEDGLLDNTDMIIGPIYSKPLEVASEYSRKMKIPIISPLSNNGIGMDDNPYMLQVNSGREVQFELASIFLSDFYNMNMIMVQDTSSLNPIARKRGSKIFDYLTYRVSPSDLLSGNIKFHPTFSEGLPEKAVMAPVEDMLSLGRKNLVMIPSDNEIFVTDIINKLNSLALNYDITVFGMPEWGSFEALEMEYLYNLKFHYYTNFSNPYVNYSDSLTLDFCHKYRSNWNSEPSRFSFQGFDVTYFFFKALYLYGNQFLDCVNCWENVLPHTSLQTEFCFQNLYNGKGLENQAMSIIRYNSETLSKEKIKSTLPANKPGPL